MIGWLKEPLYSQSIKVEVLDLRLMLALFLNLFQTFDDVRSMREDVGVCTDFLKSQDAMSVRACERLRLYCVKEFIRMICFTFHMKLHTMSRITRDFYCKFVRGCAAILSFMLLTYKCIIRFFSSA